MLYIKLERVMRLHFAEVTGGRLPK